MKKIAAIEIIGAAAQIDRIEALVEDQKRREDFDSSIVLPPRTRNRIAYHFAKLAAAASAMDAPITAKIAIKSARALRSRKDPVPLGEIATMNTSLSEILRAEVANVELYCLPAYSGAYYAPSEPLFGHAVEARLGGASDDISEGGKCFAVGRYTASVFHLMRAMESAVQTLATLLGIGDVSREWGKLLSDIARQIEPMPRGETRDAWSGVHANLYHVKQAWRNSTMHPKRTYTEEEAREVFGAVKSFMKQLAGMLPPSPEELLS